MIEYLSGTQVLGYTLSTAKKKNLLEILSQGDTEKCQLPVLYSHVHVIGTFPGKGSVTLEPGEKLLFFKENSNLALSLQETSDPPQNSWSRGSIT